VATLPPWINPEIDARDQNVVSKYPLAFDEHSARAILDLAAEDDAVKLPSPTTSSNPVARCWRVAAPAGPPSS
jgi:hypothetical protein